MSEARTGHGTDTALRGSNHIPGAEYIAIGEYPGNSFFPRLLKGMPRPIQALLCIPRLLQYDFVIAQDELFLGYIVSLCARAFRLKTRWMYVSMNSSTLMRRHSTHPMRLFLLKKFWASYARIICIYSEQLEDFVRFGISRERLAFVPFGVDVRFFQPTGVSHEKELIVSVGRDAGRDYATLFRAAERTSHAFVVVAAQKNIPLDMPVPANVSVLYDRSYGEIRDLYERARLVVITSKDVQIPDGSDCSGQTVVLDALAAGKAVIATERPWITDYFISGQDLVVIQPNNPGALAQAIDSLWNDAEKRKSLAASGHDKVAARYTTKNFAEALLALMDSVGWTP